LIHGLLRVEQQAIFFLLPAACGTSGKKGQTDQRCGECEKQQVALPDFCSHGKVESQTDRDEGEKERLASIPDSTEDGELTLVGERDWNGVLAKRGSGESC